MKKIFFLICSVLFLFALNSCREDGEWGNNNGGQFGFTIERDDDFIEKGVGEANQLKFNIEPNYDFSTVATKFKFTTNLNGTLKLKGKTLVANEEYTFDSAENVFEYTGNVAGSHKLTILVKNAKGASKEEEFTLPYGVSEFTHTYVGGSAPIYQSDETAYTMKIVPGQGQSATGYEIRFNNYSGTIKLNGVPAQTGQFYPIPNIDSFAVVLSTLQAGQTALDYTIKNPTVSKDYQIQQQVIQRLITVESMNINSTTVSPNTNMSLIGVVKKTPTTGNLNIQYKTWISSASNNNTSGMTNTNNTYMPYTLGSNGNFSYNFAAVQAGTYTYNIQFKDEFGNESEVSSFTVTVENSVTIGNAAAVIKLQRSISGPVGGTNGWYSIYHNYKGAKMSVNAEAGAGSKISKVVFDIDYVYNGQNKTVSYTYDYNTLPATIELSEETNENQNLFSGTSYSSSASPINAQGGTYTVRVFDNLGNVFTRTGTTVVQVN